MLLMAAEKNMTGNAVAYLIALYRGRLLEFDGWAYSIMHCLNLTKYGKLEDGELFDIYLYTKFQGKTHLIMIGEIHLCQPCSLGAARSVFPGTRRTTDNQTSPRTLAKEVAMSAKTMSEN